MWGMAVLHSVVMYKFVKSLVLLPQVLKCSSDMNNKKACLRFGREKNSCITLILCPTNNAIYWTLPLPKLAVNFSSVFGILRDEQNE